MLKEDEIFKKIFKILDTDMQPPEGAKKRIYQTLFNNSKQRSLYSSCLCWISEKFLKLAIQVWLLIYIFMTIFTPTIAL
ncbi:hypothetical protein [Clostridium sp.]|uniref:hypothetical protein n=1 Tax=Clostridium sp. TaxID=1506 RepID=UPI003D6CC63F